MKKCLIAASLIAATAYAPAPASAHGRHPHLGPSVEVISKIVQHAVKVDGIRRHLWWLQKIADRNGGTRASGTPGFATSVEYVKLQLRAAGYRVSVQPFDFAFFQEHSPSQLQQTSPNAVTYVNGTDFNTMQYSGPGNITAQIQAAGGIILPPSPVPSSASGCAAADFAGFIAGRIALVQRGTCTFFDKATNAAAAGASAVIIFNEGQPGRTEAVDGTLGEPVGIPVLGVSFALGQTLHSLGNPTLRVRTDTESEIRPTYNVLAESRYGDPNRTVVVGAHLDSVTEGPGINDNGSGTATILETAIQMARFAKFTNNRVRYTFFGAEEAGLLGSEHYVASLTPDQLDDILLNLNFDMLGSLNYARFVYDGNGSDTPDPGPAGSEIIENVFLNYFAGKSKATDPTAFDGRSDYGPFIDQGIPAGGLFSGAEELKTAAQVAKYGGTAGVAFDACYHQACDTFTNINNKALDELGDAAVHSIVAFAFAGADVIASNSAKSMAAAAQKAAASTRLYKGSHLQR